MSLSICLAPAAVLYGHLMTARRRRMSGRGVRLPRATIAIGNLTVGGTGKTPVVRWLSERLRDLGRRPAILTRGYRSADEPAMLARLLNRPHLLPVPVGIGANRVAAAGRVLAEDPAVDVFLLDDGFQHLRVARTVDLVLIDCTSPFGGGHLLPRGRLREPLAALGDADVVLLTRCDLVPPVEKRRISAVVARHTKAPQFACRHAPDGLRDALGIEVTPVGRERAVVVSALGNPQAFEAAAHACFEVVATRRYRDHHPYTPMDVADIRRLAADVNASVVVTTEKDWVKLEPLLTPPEADESPRWLRAGVRIEFEDAADESILLTQIVEALRLKDEDHAGRRREKGPTAEG